AMASDWTREGTDALARARTSLPEDAWRDLWRRVLAAGVPPEAATRGSNAFALSGRRTAHGAAIVAADPHLPLGLPGLCFVAGLQGPRTRAVGVMMPGVPTMPIGRNEDIAWGSTNLYARTSDLVDAKDLPLREASATVNVRGGKPRRLVWRESTLGPIVSDTRTRPHAEPVALRWMGHAPSDETGALLAVARARNWAEFRAALDGFAVPGLNFTFADREGRVGQLRAAHVPRGRARDPDDLLLTPDQAWTADKRATATDLPAVFDPDEGFVVSANEAPPAEGPVIGFYFPPPDRALRLRELIAPLRDATVDGLRHLQADVFHAPALAGRDRLLTAFGPGPRTAKAQAILNRMSAWDGFYDAESIGATAYEFILARLVALLLKRRPLAVYDAIRRSRAMIFEDLAALPVAELRRTTEKALAAVARHWPADARWGTVHALAPNHPLHALPRIGRAFAAPRLPGAGCNDTVAKTSHGLSFKPHVAGFGAALRHVADLGDPDANWFRLFGGQDGWAGSENALDQLAGWHQGADIQVPLRIESVRRRFARRLVIRPA
ncbi:MAG: penicillin acylase family protein, partial [Zavarzinia sp.]|nr:penicillin acylase family protein [Zavarzinia sp.]